MRPLNSRAGPGHLADAEDDELRRAHNRHADLRHHAPLIYGALRVSLRVALDVEGFGRAGAEQRARTPDLRQEGRHVTRDLLPEAGLVRLEHDPLRALVYGLPQEEQGAADVDVLQVRVVVAADGARAP